MKRAAVPPADPSPTEPASRTRLFLIAGLALIAAGAASWGLRADPLHGLTARYYDNPTFEGEPAREIQEREPFVPMADTPPFSATWTGWFFVPRAGRYSFQLSSDDDSELDLDGEPVASDPGQHEPRLVSGRPTELAVGLHAFKLLYIQRGAGAYLRVGYHYDSGPIGSADPADHPIGRPLPWSQLFPESFPATPAAYAAAEGAYQRQRVLAGLALGAFIVSLLLAWIEWRRRRGIPPVAPVELATSLGLFAVAWVTRLVGLDAQGRTWDERDYYLAGLHYIRNLFLGDGAHLAFRYNYEHPPIAKWIYGVATALFAHNDDDHTPGKLFASIMGAATCVLLYLIVRELYDPMLPPPASASARRPAEPSFSARRTGLLAGLLCAFAPSFVAHGKILGLESPMTLFYVAAIYGIVRWFKDDTRLEPVVWAGLCTSLAIFSRMTAVWVIPTLLLPYLDAVISGPNRGRRALAIFPYLGGLTAGVALAYLLWPWIWHNPYDQIMQTWSHWRGWKTREWYLGNFHEPPLSYYQVAFLLSAPVGYLIPSLAWAASSLWKRRPADHILAGFLFFPFLQSISEFRQDAVRYVVQAFPALAATSAVGFFWLWSLAEKKLPALRKPWAPIAGAGALVAYALGCCIWIHPYYLDYFNEILGGPAGIQRGKTVELSWWGEGITNLVDWVNANAPRGSHIAEHLYPYYDKPQWRPDLVTVPEKQAETQADYIVLNDFSFAFAQSADSANLAYFGAGPEWECVYHARAGNQDIGWVYHRKR